MGNSINITPLKTSSTRELAHQIAAQFAVLTIESGGRTYYYNADESCSVYDNVDLILTNYTADDRRRDLPAESEMVARVLDKRCRSMLESITAHLSETASATLEAVRDSITERCRNGEPILPSELAQFLRSLKKASIKNDPTFNQDISPLMAGEEVLRKLTHSEHGLPQDGMISLNKLLGRDDAEEILEKYAQRRAQDGDPCRVHIYSRTNGTCSTAGMAKLLGRDLHARIPSLHIDIDVHGTSSLVETCDLRINFGSAQGGVVVSDAVNDAATHVMDITGSLGSMPMDRSLYNRRAVADQMSLSDLTALRRAWIKQAVHPRIQRELDDVFGDGLPYVGWGFGYYQDSRGFMASVEKVVEWYQAKRSPQNPLIYFVSEGKHVGDIAGRVNRNTLIDLGVGIIDPEHAFENVQRPQVPLYLCFVPNMKNSQMLEFLSELHGYPYKDDSASKKNSYWVQPPALVSGNTVTFEAFSSCIPVLHDGYEASRNGFAHTADTISDITGLSRETCNILCSSGTPLANAGELNKTARQIASTLDRRDLCTDVIRQLLKQATGYTTSI